MLQQPEPLANGQCRKPSSNKKLCRLSRLADRLRVESLPPNSHLLCFRNILNSADPTYSPTMTVTCRRCESSAGLLCSCHARLACDATLLSLHRRHESLGVNWPRLVDENSAFCSQLAVASAPCAISIYVCTARVLVHYKQNRSCQNMSSCCKARSPNWS